MRVNIKKIDPSARVPDYSHRGDAAMNLYAVSCAIIHPGSTEKVSTGIAVEIPFGYAGLIWDRSSLGSKGIKRMGGVIDSGYRGEIIVALLNTTSEPYEIKAGDKIAQMIIQKIEEPEIVEVDDLTDTTRGDGGFGSTGR